MNIEEIKAELAKQEKALANPKLLALMGDKIQAKVDGLKKQLSELEGKAEEKVEEAEKKVEEAKSDGTKAEIKEAVADLKEAKAEEKEVAKVAEKAEKVAEKAEEKTAKPAEMDKPKSHGGARPNAGRKVGSKMKKPKGVDVKVVPMRKRKAKKAKVSVREKLSKTKAIAKASVKSVAKTKTKSVRAFGQTVEYKNDSDFCRQLISAFKKRKSVSKANGKRRKTKPVFGVIVSSTKNAVSKALHNVSEKTIEKNPKEFLAKATRLEKSAIRFLEDFKAILGSDFKKAEISAEFGELEKSIKNWIAKISK